MPTLPTPQPPIHQQILVLAVALALRLVALRQCLRRLEGRFVKNRRHGHGDPRVWLNPAPGGFAVWIRLPWHALSLTIAEAPHIGRVVQNRRHGRLVPDGHLEVPGWARFAVTRWGDPFLTIIRTTIAQYYVKQAVKSGIERQKVQPGSVTCIQRFGGAINLNVHYHVVFLEGVYLDRTEAGLKPRFIKGAPPSDADITEVLQKISRRVIRTLRQ